MASRTPSEYQQNVSQNAQGVADMFTRIMKIVKAETDTGDDMLVPPGTDLYAQLGEYIDAFREFANGSGGRVGELVMPANEDDPEDEPVVFDLDDYRGVDVEPCVLTEDGVETTTRDDPDIEFWTVYLRTTPSGFAESVADFSTRVHAENFGAGLGALLFRRMG